MCPARRRRNVRSAVSAGRDSSPPSPPARRRRTRTRERSPFGLAPRGPVLTHAVGHGLLLRGRHFVAPPPADFAGARLRARTWSRCGGAATSSTARAAAEFRERRANCCFFLAQLFESPF